MFQASQVASEVDAIFAFIVIVSLIFLALITVAMVYFSIRYHRTRHTTPKDIEGNVFLEVVWTVIPTILVMMMFWYGWDGFRAMRKVDPNAIIIKTTAQMWSWHFTYGNGKESPELYVPLGKPVKLELESRDVLHSFFISAFRVKEDVVPGKNNYVTFTAIEPGSYDIQCTEYCGQRHSYMLSKVHVLPEPDFNIWLAAVPVVAAGEPLGLTLLKSKGCVACHTTDGKPLVGPSFKGLFGRMETVVTNGEERQVKVDEAYLHQSMIEPNADVVKTFPPIMPSQKGILSDEEIDAIIAYIKELK